jgi:hypothetical protein
MASDGFARINIAAAHGFARFGLGRRHDEPEPGDPAAWVRAQLQPPDTDRISLGSSTIAGLTALRHDREVKPPPGESQARMEYRAAAEAELAKAIATVTPFRERLVWFWTNHFTVSLRRGEVAAFTLLLTSPEFQRR